MLKNLFILIVLVVLFSGATIYLQKELEKTPLKNTLTVPTPLPTPQNTTKIYYSVTRVVDGDTIIVDMNGTEERIRLVGVNTPESVDPRRPVQCFGKEASAFLKKILDGREVTLEKDSSQGDTDKYHRLLRYVYLPNGTFINKLLIEEGYGHEYTYRTPYKYQLEFKKAEQEARTTKRGLWNESVCATP